MDSPDYATLTVCFDDPFWVGILETCRDGVLYVGRHTFGAEPTNPQLLSFCLDELAHLEVLKTELTAGSSPRGMGFKRSLREAKKLQATLGSTSRADAAYKQAFEREMAKRQSERAFHKRSTAALAFEARQEKKKERRRGH